MEGACSSRVFPALDTVRHRRVQVALAENRFLEPLLSGQRAVIAGEALNATFDPATCPPTNSATSNDAANKLPPIIAKKTNVGFVARHFPLLHGNFRCRTLGLRCERRRALNGKDPTFDTGFAAAGIGGNPTATRLSQTFRTSPSIALQMSVLKTIGPLCVVSAGAADANTAARAALYVQSVFAPRL